MIKELASRVREYKKDSILAAVFVLVEVVADVGLPIVMVQLIDEGVTKGNMSVIMRVGLLLVFFTIVSLVFGILSGNRAAHASAGFGKNLRGDMFEKIQAFSFENIDKFSTASLITRLTTDITNIQGAYQMIVRVAVRSPIMILLAVGMTFWVNPKLAIIYVIVTPIAALALFLIITKVHPVFERVFRTYDTLNQVVQENIHGIRVVKTFVQEEQEITKFSGISKNIYTDFVRAEKILALNNPVLQTAIYLCMLVLAWFGAKMIVSSDMTTGELMSMLTYTMQILMNLMLLSMVFVMIVISRAGAERSVEILTEQSKIANGENPVYEIPDATITFEDVSFSYGSTAHEAALRGVTLAIPPGEVVGIIGGTGSSKTTLVQLIPRLYDTTQGRVSIGGIDVKDYDIDTLRNGVAMVLQKNVLFSGSVAENLRWGSPSATPEELREAANWAQADGFIMELPDGYDSHVEQGGANFSGGQRQRLCIARALLKRPKILILDDSTSAVDTKTDAHIRNAFRNEIPETTKIIIAQRIASVQDADKIIVMEDGCINGMGTHTELLATNQIYQEVYHSQNQGGFGE